MEVRASVDPAVATTGDRVRYVIEVQRDPALEVELPEPGGEIAGFRIIDLGREQETLRTGREVERWWFELRADLVGSYVLPATTVSWREPDAESWNVAETSTLFVEVASVIPEDGTATDSRGRGPREPPPPTPGWVGAALAGGVTALGLGVAGARRWRRPRVEPPPPPAHEVAFAALEALRAADLDQSEHVHAFHFDISTVIRAYVEGRFGLNATDLTCEEIVSRLGELDELTPEQRRDLRAFLQTTDRVKFAGHSPDEGEISTTWEQALGFVESTVPAPAEA